MGHNVVYGFDESKCQVEVLAKNKSFGIAKTETHSAATVQEMISIPTPQANTRLKILNFGKLILSDFPETLADNFNFEVVFYRRDGFITSAFMSNVIQMLYSDNTEVPVMWITPYNFKLSNCTAIHLYVFWDGINVCCRVEGY